MEKQIDTVLETDVTADELEGTSDMLTQVTPRTGLKESVPDELSKVRSSLLCQGETGVGMGDLGFGLSAAPGAFQQVVDRLITPALEPNEDNDLGNTVAAYIDDVCIAGENFEQMLQRLQALFNRVRAGGFLLKAKKCDLFQPEVSFLGHRLSSRSAIQSQVRPCCITMAAQLQKPHWKIGTLAGKVGTLQVPGCLRDKRCS